MPDYYAVHGGRRRRDGRSVFEKTVYEPRVATRRIQSALLALGIITVVGALGYMVFEGWSFTDALYMTVITLPTVGYREVRTPDTTGQLWTMVLLITGVGTLFYAAVSSVELVVEGTIRGYFGRVEAKTGSGPVSRILSQAWPEKLARWPRKHGRLADVPTGFFRRQSVV